MDEAKEVKPIVLRTDARLEAIKSLERLYKFIFEVKADTYQWKWAIIALHNSAQAFMVLALKGTIDFNVLRQDQKNKWIEYFNSQHQLPMPSKKPRLEYFTELYERTKSNEMNMYVNSKPFIGDLEDDRSIELLNEFRNNFVHFIPCSWIIYIDGLPRICERVVLFIEFLVLESGNIHYHGDEFEHNRTVQLISDIKEELKILDEMYSI